MYLRKSPQRSAKLKHCCRMVGCPELEPVEDVKTRFWSIFSMVARIIALRPAIESYCALEPELAELNLSASDWDALPRLKSLLHDMTEVTKLVEGDK